MQDTNKWKKKKKNTACSYGKLHVLIFVHDFFLVNFVNRTNFVIKFSPLFSDKDRRTDSWIRRKKIAPPRWESNQGLALDALTTELRSHDRDCVLFLAFHQAVSSFFTTRWPGLPESTTRRTHFIFIEEILFWKREGTQGGDTKGNFWKKETHSQAWTCDSSAWPYQKSHAVTSRANPPQQSDEFLVSFVTFFAHAKWHPSFKDRTEKVLHSVAELGPSAGFQLFVAICHQTTAAAVKKVAEPMGKHL